jgi:hypothetical protein
MTSEGSSMRCVVLGAHFGPAPPHVSRWPPRRSEQYQILPHLAKFLHRWLRLNRLCSCSASWTSNLVESVTDPQES